jgi:hypothetical protein
MKTTFTFTVLRYVHDVATGEFVNMGVALYAPEANYVSAICNPRYGRLNRVFLDVNGDQVRSLMRFIQARFEEYRVKLNSELPLDGRPKSIMEIAASILPPDDSALQWSEPGGGISEDPAATLEQLFTRFVEKYEQKPPTISRSEADVWRVYRRELEQTQVLARLQTKRIVAKDDEYEFEHAWKNGLWRLYEPISFDLVEPDSLVEKANRWLGRATNLAESADDFQLFVLLGEPQLEKLKQPFVKALNILNKMPVKKVFVHEQEAAKFSRELAGEIQQHP